MTDAKPLTGLELLTTTRSVRRRIDRTREVDRDLLLRCLEVAMQAPNGADEQAWRWIVVTDEKQREKIGACYHAANEQFAASVTARADAGDEAAKLKLASSGVFWDHLGEVPVLVIACFEPQPWFDGASPYALASAYGSIFPAVWNFQLACRLEGLASCLITSHLRFADEIAKIVELPDQFIQAGIVAVGHLIGSSFQPARRNPLNEVVRFDRWS